MVTLYDVFITKRCRFRSAKIHNSKQVLIVTRYRSSEIILCFSNSPDNRRKLTRRFVPDVSLIFAVWFNFCYSNRIIQINNLRTRR